MATTQVLPLNELVVTHASIAYVDEGILGERTSTIIAFSDAHECPSIMSDELGQVIRIAKAENARLISIGDIADMIPWGIEVYKVSGFKHMLLKELDGYPMDLLGGNHDSYKWLKKLFADSPNIRVHKRLEFYWEPMDKWLHFRHGHEWFIDWRLLRHVAPPVVRFMVTNFPKQWYWIATRMGWIPSEIKREKRYHIIVREVWKQAIQYALNRSKQLTKGKRWIYPAELQKVIVFNGHTHAFGAQLAMFDSDDIGYIQADSATLAIGSYMRIDKRVNFCRL